MDFGPGYRVYFGHNGNEYICFAGDSRTLSRMTFDLPRNSGGRMTRKTSSYRQSLLAALADPSEAAEYLNAAIEAGTGAS